MSDTATKTKWCYDCHRGANPDYVVLCDRHAPVDEITDVLREALNSRNESHHGNACKYWDGGLCNCWVSRAREIVGEK